MEDPSHPEPGAEPQWLTCAAVEREKGFEPSTSTLARLHSTTELLPLTDRTFSGPRRRCQARLRGIDVIVADMLPRGVIFGLRATIVVMSLGAAGCHTKPGTLPVDSPVYTYKAPEMDDDDEDTNDSSEESGGEEAGSGAKKE